jgi:hypothetical protein
MAEAYDYNDDFITYPPAYADLSLGQPNIRHEYENTTYDLTLAMATERDTNAWMKKAGQVDKGVSASEMNSLDSDLFKDEVTILAQTATSTAQITSLNIESTCAPTKANNLTYSAKFNFTVTQPLGVDFLRDIYTTAAFRGIQNHYTHPYFLQIFLKGRNKDGIEELEVPGTRRLYCIYISNITYKVDIGQSVYEVTAIRNSDMGLADDHNLVSGISMSNVNSFGDFVTKFQESLRQIERHNLGQTKLILDQYEVKVVGPLSGEGFSPDKEIENAFMDANIIQDFDKKNIAIQDVKTGDVKVEIEKNTKITDIIEKFINRNKWVVDYMAKIKEDYIKAFSEKSWEKVNVSKLVPTISTSSENISYDPLRRDYARKYTYVIHLTKSTTPPIGIREEFNGGTEYTNKRIKNYREERSIRKRYDYNFTGVNLDVLNFDLQYNYQYVYGLDTLTGLYNKYGDIFFSDLTNEQLNSQKKIDEARAKGGQGSNYWSAANKDGEITAEEKFRIAQYRYEILKKTRELLNQPGVEPDANTLQAYNELVKDYNNSRANYQTLVGSDTGETSFTDPGNNKPLKALDRSPKSSTLSAQAPGVRGQVYAEDFRDGSVYRQFQKNPQFSGGMKEYGANMGTVLPIQFYGRTMQKGNDGMVGVGESTAFQTMLNNAKIGSAEMVRVTLDIIGDTFWLDDPAESAEAIQPDKFNRKKENVILFHTVFPQQPNPRTGQLDRLDQREDQFLTALYKVWKVDHMFDNGMYNTRLHMVRDTLTDLALMTERSQTDEEKTQMKEKKAPIKQSEKKDNNIKKDASKPKVEEKVKTPPVVGNDLNQDAKVTSKNADQVSGKKSKLKVDGKEVTKEEFNKHYYDKYQHDKSVQWNADNTRIIGGF